MQPDMPSQKRSSSSQLQRRGDTLGGPSRPGMPAPARPRRRSDFRLARVRGGGHGVDFAPALKGARRAGPFAGLHTGRGSMRYGRIIGWGKYVPPHVLTNFDLEKMVHTSDEWIVTRTGIRERRIAGDGETTLTMSVAAARQAPEGAGLR